MNLEESKLNFIQESLIKFIHKHCGSAGGDLGASMDMIILSYVLQVLQEEEEDSVEVVDFCEMLSGYFPCFQDIPKKEVELWMTQVSRQLRKREQKNSSESSCDEFIMTVFGGTSTRTGSSSSNSNTDKKVPGHGDNGQKGATNTTSTTRTESTPSPNELLLLEMFPSLQLSDISTVLALSQNQVEKAVQILLEEECLERKRRPSKTKEIDEKALRDRVVQRYGFVDKDKEGKEFRPELPKEEPKKLVRYREGQVVSTKGERFTEVVVNQDGEETKFKPWISKPNKNH